MAELRPSTAQVAKAPNCEPLTNGQTTVPFTVGTNVELSISTTAASPSPTAAWRTDARNLLAPSPTFAAAAASSAASLRVVGPIMRDDAAAATLAVPRRWLSQRAERPAGSRPGCHSVVAAGSSSARLPLPARLMLQRPSSKPPFPAKVHDKSREKKVLQIALMWAILYIYKYTVARARACVVTPPAEPAASAADVRERRCALAAAH